MEKTIAVMLDDVLNNFTAMLREMGVDYHPQFQSISDQQFRDVLYEQSGELTPLAEKAMGSAAVCKDGVAFLMWLKENGWTVVLCTDRDIRMAYDLTKEWLDTYKVPFDYLFTATSPAGLCMDMGLSYLIYSLPGGKENHFNVVSFPEQSGGQPKLLGDFQKWGEVEQCLAKTNC